MTKYYAGIGARNTPDDILIKMEEIAYKLARKGWVLRSGGARGADKAFEDGCIRGGGNAELFIPSKRGDQQFPLWTNLYVDHFHPTPHRLNDYSRPLMQRNAMILLGEGGSDSAAFVVCWTPNGEVVGGTGHTLKIAQYFKIPIYNLAIQKG